MRVKIINQDSVDFGQTLPVERVTEHGEVIIKDHGLFFAREVEIQPE